MVNHPPHLVKFHKKILTSEKAEQVRIQVFILYTNFQTPTYSVYNFTCIFLINNSHSIHILTNYCPPKFFESDPKKKQYLIENT